MAPSSQVLQILLWRGSIGRVAFLVVGVLLTILKTNLLRYVTLGLFQARPEPLFYLVPSIGVLSVNMEAPEYRAMMVTMVALSIPFAYIGLALTLARLRSIGANLLLAVFFVIPMVNLFFFAVLCVLPERPAEESADATAIPGDAWKRYIPRGKVAASIFAGMGTALVGILFTFISTFAVGSYGLVLFVGVPFVMGLMAVIIYSVHQRCTLRMAAGLAILSVLFASVTMLILALEGIICIAMALPLAIPLALMGAFLGYCIQRHDLGYIFPVVLLGTPLLMGAENRYTGRAPLHAVHTSIEVNAPPDVVWHHVVSFSELPPMTNPIFASGIAYPMRAEMHGEGVGAVRHCVFSTGPFVEPIEVWDAPRRLEFSVREHPPAFQEWSTFHGLIPPHLDQYFRSERGRFLLQPLDGGTRTRLTGTTWYRHDIRPAIYWHLWSSTIVHRIHQRVLDHVKNLAEESNKQS